MGILKRKHRWHYRFVLNGRIHSGPTGLEATEANRSQALEVEAEARLRAKGGRPPLREVSFMAAAEKFLAWARTEYAPETSRRLCVSLASAEVFFGGGALHRIRPGDVEQYKAWRRTVGRVGAARRVAEVTIRHDCHALSKLFAFGRKCGWLDGDPLAGVSIPSDADSRRERILAPAEERSYFAAAARQPGGALHDVGRLMILQGLRPSEAFRLRAAHVDLDAAELHIVASKSRAGRRTLPLLPESVGILARRIEQSAEDGRAGDWLFPGRGRGDAHLSRLSAAHKKACEASGVPCRLYDLRHTFASRMAGSGAPLSTLAKILGHGDTKTLARYVHPQADEARRAMLLMAAAFEPAKQGKVN